jgi:hypothetical protein
LDRDKPSACRLGWESQLESPETEGAEVEKIFWRRLISLMLFAVMALQLGCSTQGSVVGRTPVPGSNIYCLRESTDAAFRTMLQDSRAFYGPHKLGKLGNGSICDLVQFYTYTVSWETKDGHKERHEFDLERLMKKLQEEKPEVKTMNQHSSQPQVTIEYQAGQVQVYFRVSQYQLDGMEMRNGLEVLTKPATVTKFPLLTVPLNALAGK